MRYRVDWGLNIWKNGRKTHNLGISGDFYRYKLKLYRYNFVTGHFWPSSTGTTATLFPVSTSFGNLAITCSFLIQFE